MSYLIGSNVVSEWTKSVPNAGVRSWRAGVMDAWIAATAAVYGMTVVTRDVAPFQGLAVRCFNPWTE